MRLHSAAAAAGYRLLSHETLPSTNAEALASARSGDSGKLWLTAALQTAGRGRRGNQWSSPAGNLYATLLLVDPAPAEYGPQLCFVTALAVHDAILELAPSFRRSLTLKWPNDVLRDGAKLAGILIESERVEGALAVAIGVGVNCGHHPEQTAYPATDLAASGAGVSPGDLLEALSRTMMERLEQWQEGRGFAAIRADWLARAAGIGGDMRVRLPGRELVGCGETVDEHGRLLLRLPDGNIQAIAAGDVFPLGTAGAVSAPAAGRAG